MAAETFPHDVRFPLGELVPEAPAEATVSEPGREVPVVAECDVAVLGGGPAGVCAAAAAARTGRRTVLIERYGHLGGMATAGWVCIFHTLYGTDRRTKVIGGLAEEFIRRMQREGAIRNTADDGETGDWAFCSETARFICDDVVLGCGVRLMLHTWLAGAVVKGRRLKAALVESKSGRGAVLADTFVDCTGDADLLRRAGAATEIGNPEGRCQSPTLVFRVGGKKPDAASPGEIQAALADAIMDYSGGGFPCHVWGVESVWSPTEQMLAGTRVTGIDAADARDLTRAEVEARYQLRWLLRRMRKMPGWDELYLVDVAEQIGVRETHRAVAEHRLRREEVLEGRAFDDAIAQGTFPVEIHSPDGPGMTVESLDGRRRSLGAEGGSEWSRWDEEPEDAPPRETLCWRVPYRSLVPRDLSNVLVAGRSIGADHAAAGATRVMVSCMQSGQAAGTAAAMVSPGDGVRDVDTGELRTRLVADGMPLL